jgi:hypothetical protein
METKQTAVEWLIETINEGGGFIFTSHYEKLFKQAKQMEKEQIMKAYFEGESDGDHLENSTQIYYNETYGPQVDKK